MKWSTHNLISLSLQKIFAGILLGLLSLLAACSDDSQFSGKKDRKKEHETVVSSDISTEAGTGRSSSEDAAGGPGDPSSDENGEMGPQETTLRDPGKIGPYSFTSYSDPNLNDPGYQSAMIYYPTDAPDGSRPATTLSGGFTNTKEQMTWLAEHLASHGFIVLVFTPTNNLTLDPNIWATGHKASLNKLKAEHQRSGSPIAQKIRIDRLGIMGFSMGGAGTIVAVNELGAEGVQAAVPLCAYQPQVPTASIPTLLLTGNQDTIAVPGNVRSAYQQMNTGAPKGFAEFNGMAHLDVTNQGVPAQHENLARFGTAWYLVYLDEQTAYQTYLNGDELAKQKAKPEVFVNDSDYMFEEP